MKEDKARVASDWSNALYPLNSASANPSAQYGTTDEFLRLPTPGAVLGGIDLQNCYPALVCGPVAPTPPRSSPSGHWYPGGVLIPTLSVGASPGWNDASVKALLKVSRSRLQRLGILEFADDLRLVTTDAWRDTLAADMAGVTSSLGDMGIRYRAKAGKRWWPTRRIPRLGFEAGAYRGAVSMEESNVLEGPRPREEIFGASPGSEMSARTLLNFFTGLPLARC